MSVRGLAPPRHKDTGTYTQRVYQFRHTDESPRQDLNLRQPLYKSGALPAELQGRVMGELTPIPGSPLAL